MRWCHAKTFPFSLICGCLSIFLKSEDASARLVPPRDPCDGVLDASLVVIVTPEAQDRFRTVEVFLGQQGTGGSIELPGFKLYTVPQHGPELVEPMTPDTRILLFLREKEGGWEVTHHGYSFFWRHEVEKVGELRVMAEEAVSLRRSWEAARDSPDVNARVDALWPYLWEHGISFLEHTRRELQRIGPASGDHIAQKFEVMTHRQRMTMLPDLGAYRSERGHEALTRHLQSQQQLYERFLVERGPGAESLIEDWDHAPEKLKEISGELYYGLAGLASFEDRSDLPYLREMALWAIARRFKQTCDAALGAFRSMPDEANLPVIQTIWREFSARQFEGNELLSFDIVRALHTHVYPEAVPLLVGFLNDANAGSEARAALAQIAGKDLGDSPNAWLDWYNTQSHR